MKLLLGVTLALALLMWGIGAFASDCVNVDLGARVIPGDPLNHLELYFSLVNCGTAQGIVALTITLEKNGGTPCTGTIRFPLQAGQSIDQNLLLPIPQKVPAGEYTLCVAAQLGTASDQACATIVLDAMNNVIGFTPEGTLPVEDTTWGAIKATFE